MKKTIAILQSNYIPWKGYFDLIAAVDEFIIYDEMQYTKNDWRNRNKLKTPKGTEWITIPTGQDINRKICDVEIKDTKWQKKHWKTFESNYSRAPHFKEISEWLYPIYNQETHDNLSSINKQLIKAICNYLGIKTLISDSRDYKIGEGKVQRLINLCIQAKASKYLSGPAAREYIDETLFTNHDITVNWFDYSQYPEYPQAWGDFEHGVSILDLLFNCGRDSYLYMKYVKGF